MDMNQIFDSCSKILNTSSTEVDDSGAESTTQTYELAGFICT